MATRQEIRAKLDEYDAAADDRTAKRTVRDEKFGALEGATSEFEKAQMDYREAVIKEGTVEDELEAMSVAHEPDAQD